MAFPKTEQQWAERAVRFLKAELKRADVTYDELADRLEQYGFFAREPGGHPGQSHSFGGYLATGKLRQLSTSPC
jgi:hypothetical protein